MKLGKVVAARRCEGIALNEQGQDRGDAVSVAGGTAISSFSLHRTAQLNPGDLGA